MLFRFFLYPIVTAVLLSGCALLKQSPKNNFTNGLYSTKATNGQSKKVYVDVREEAVTMYFIKKAANKLVLDSTQHKPVSFGSIRADSSYLQASFLQNSFDVDVLTIPFKYRFQTNTFPRQFTTQLNGGIYLGHRTDIYALHYASNPVGTVNRSVNHLGFSIGGFTGIGSTTMNPWVTRDQITLEYEGVAWSKGMAAIAGLNNFTAGLAVGWDHLLDGNRTYWIYQGKPWIGFVFGLNLN